MKQSAGGWKKRLDRMPLEGDAVSYSGYRFTALSVDTRRIGQVHIQSTAADEPEEEE
jgi:CBS domain containing-hemolysin-like protein